MSATMPPGARKKREMPYSEKSDDEKVKKRKKDKSFIFKVLGKLGILG